MGSGSMMRELSGYEFEELAEEYGFLLVYPDGFDRHWNDCRGSADYQANIAKIDDVGFFQKIIAKLVAEQKADARRVFATGLSNGGHMSYAWAMQSPDDLRAIAPVAANIPVANNRDCEQRNGFVATAIFNGTEDKVNPWQGGLVSIMGNDSRGEVLSSEDSVAYWRQLGNISDEGEQFPHPEYDGDMSTAIIETRWGKGANQVRLYRMEGSGHVIPSTRVKFPRMIGPAAGDISGPKEILRFFVDVEGGR